MCKIVDIAAGHFHVGVSNESEQPVLKNYYGLAGHWIMTDRTSLGQAADERLINK